MIGEDDENGQRPSGGGADASVLREDVLKTLAAHLDAIESTGFQISEFSLRQTEEGYEAEFEVTPTKNSEQTLGLIFTVQATTIVNEGERNKVNRNGEDSNGPTKCIDSLWESLDHSDCESARTGSVRVESSADEPAVAEEAADPMAENEESVDGEKPYRDPERLREVYDEYDTFPEMRDALGVEVTPQTIRRHMIDHGIHEVSSNETLEALKKMGEEHTEKKSRSQASWKSYKKTRGES